MIITAKPINSEPCYSCMQEAEVALTKHSARNPEGKGQVTRLCRHCAEALITQIHGALEYEPYDYKRVKNGWVRV